MSKPETTSKPLQGAYRKGLQAARAGEPYKACPYQSAPYGCRRRNGGTWGAVFRNYWRRGWRASIRSRR
mgnify:CR=1 FL=1